MHFRFRELMFLLVLLGVAGLSVFYVFMPELKAVQEARKETSVKEARLDELADITARIPDLSLEITRGQEAISMIEAKLPSEQLVDSILEQVWLIAKENKLTVKGVKSEKPIPAALYRELPLKMSMEGGFDGFYQFLLQLESLSRITRVHELTLERVDGKGGAKSEDLPPGAMKAEFTLSIYFDTDQEL